MISALAKEICADEAQSFQRTQNEFRALSEHTKNEIIDSIEQRGIDADAFDAEKEQDCIDIMAGAVSEMHRELQPQYPRLHRLKKMLTLLTTEICNSYFKDK